MAPHIPEAGSKGRRLPIGVRRRAAVAALFMIVLCLPLAAWAGSPQVQEINGRLALHENLFYDLPALKQGDKLSVYVKGASGTLDPFAALLKSGVDLAILQRDYFPGLKQQGFFYQAKPEAMAVLNDNFFSVWDDRSGGRHAARFTFTVPTSGAYRLLVRSTPWRATFGDFRLLLALNAPEPLTDETRPTGLVLANHTETVWQAAQRVDEIDGTLTPEQQFRSVELHRVYKGETLFMYLKATSGSLPTAVLQDYSGLPLASGKPGKDGKTLTLTYTFKETDNNPRVRVFFPQLPGKAPSAGAYHLLVGINTPQVLSGQVEKRGRPIIYPPIPVQIGLKMHQITSVDQKGENFGVVASLKMIWQDPALGFDPEICQCFIKTFTGDAFQRFVAENGLRWPEFAVFNQQGNRWFQNRLVMVWPDGLSIYFERFSVTLQAPDFNFRKFPFDRQDFYIRIDSLRPDWIYVFEDLPGFSEVGKQLGEEEWVVGNFDTLVSTQTETTDLASSRFSFHFQARRHLTYYIFRIFLPLFIILTVSWFTFFLRDYSKRVDVAGGNLLLFIAFNFAIASDLPRLGYLTFMDLNLIITFVITSFILLLAVFLKRLEMDGKIGTVRQVDTYVIILYPLIYLVAVAIVAVLAG